MRVVFFGSPEFAIHILDALLKNSIDVVAVVSQPPRPKGRSKHLVPTLVAQKAMAADLPLFEPEKATDPTFIAELEKLSADLFIVVGYGKILRNVVLDLPRLGCINVHTSLLPAYRGAAPVQRALMDGVTETGATIMYMVREMDAGDIIKQVNTFVGEDQNLAELELELAKIGSQALLDVIKDLNNGKIIRHPQEEAKVTFAPKIEPAECELDWQKPARCLHNQVRGVYHRPGAWCRVRVKEREMRLKVHRTECVDLQGEAGALLTHGSKDLIVACGTGALRLVEIQPEGKRAMSGGDWLRGVLSQKLTFLVPEH